MNPGGDTRLLEYLRKAATYIREGEADIRIAIITNFTDDILKKVLIGMCVTEGIRPEVYATPFKQYAFVLKDAESPLSKFNADITFVLFDFNPYEPSEFIVNGHGAEVLAILRHIAIERLERW